MFDDLLDANRHYRTEFHDPGADGRAAGGLAVLTCIDSRIDPLAVLGLQCGDAKIIRDAGAGHEGFAPFFDSTNLLGATRVCVVKHSDCAMVGPTDDELCARIGATRGVDATDWDCLASIDQLATSRDDIAVLESCALLPPDVQVDGFIFRRAQQ